MKLNNTHLTFKQMGYDALDVKFTVLNVSLIIFNQTAAAQTSQVCFWQAKDTN